MTNTLLMGAIKGASSVLELNRIPGAPVICGGEKTNLQTLFDKYVSTEYESNLIHFDWIFRIFNLVRTTVQAQENC